MTPPSSISEMGRRATSGQVLYQVMTPSWPGSICVSVNVLRLDAPLAGHYPCLRLGLPWWFFDSVKGMERYLDSVVETAGIYNLAGFNDDTRAFASIPARHELWRRVTCNWLAREVVHGLMDEADAAEVAEDLAYRLAKQTYNLSNPAHGGARER
jgi:glucuronate isomerase